MFNFVNFFFSAFFNSQYVSLTPPPSLQAPSRQSKGVQPIFCVFSEIIKLQIKILCRVKFLGFFWTNGYILYVIQYSVYCIWLFIANIPSTIFARVQFHPLLWTLSLDFGIQLTFWKKTYFSNQAKLLYCSIDRVPLRLWLKRIWNA